jgi:dienelactone hydrolase
LLTQYGFRELSSASPLPAVLVFHAFAGITEFEENQAARLAQVLPLEISFVYLFYN